MKTNLKNRPHWTAVCNNCEEGKDFEKWFKAFEKELREKRRHMKAGKSMALFLFIKEVLGE